MKQKSKLRPYWIRLLVVLAIAIFASWAFNEAVYQFQKEDYDRAPRVIQLVIPKGTSRLVEAGQDPPLIPAELVFVVGDMLEVKNEDEVSHQVGPIWVPPATTGSLVMDTPEKQLFSCSFQTSRYLGVDVRQPTTLGTRLTALGLVAPTTAALLFLYSLVIFPIDGKPARKELISVASQPAQASSPILATPNPEAAADNHGSEAQ